MKDILFLYPLFYTANGLRRFAQYLSEEDSGLTFDVYAPCSNPDILDEARGVAEENGFYCALRDNYGAGAGALWWLQHYHGDVLTEYRYVWYFEESCEPVRRGWMRRLLCDLENGLPVTGWWWVAEGRKRCGAVPHSIRGKNGHRVICYENTGLSGVDADGYPFDGLFDVPGYRGETFVVRSPDFRDFPYPDPREPFWESRNGVRTYAVKAERFWWRPEEVHRHGYPFPSPNIQWHLLDKYRVFPSPRNIHRGYLRELAPENRDDENYRPAPIGVRFWKTQVVRSVSVLEGLSNRTCKRLTKTFHHVYS